MSVSKIAGKVTRKGDYKKRKPMKSLAGRTLSVWTAKMPSVTSNDIAGLKGAIYRDRTAGLMLGKIVQKLVKRSTVTGKTFELLVEVKRGRMAQIVVKEEDEIITPSDAPSKPEAEEDDLELETALAAARERGRTRVAEIMTGPEMLSADRIADRLDVTRMSVNTWRENGRLLGLGGPKRGYRFPDWQLNEVGMPYEELPRLKEMLGDPWAIYRFCVQSHGELDGLTGLEALRKGKRADVLSAAESVGRDFS